MIKNFKFNPKIKMLLKNKETGEELTIFVKLYDERNGLINFPVDLNKFEVLEMEEYKKCRYTSYLPIIVNTWTNENTKNDPIEIKENDEFLIGKWSGVESVLTKEGDYVCDTDSTLFTECFKIIDVE